MSSINFFPRAKAGLPIRKDRIEDWIRVVFALSVDARAFLEDLDGSGEMPHYREGVRWRLVELLGQLELQLLGGLEVPEEHHAALLFEYGMTEVAALSGECLFQMFGNQNVEAGLNSAASVSEFWQALMADFPGEVPNPLTPSGQSGFVRGLRSWDKAARAAGVDTKFIARLMEEV